MGLERVWIIPLAHFVFTLGAFIVSYAIAVGGNHIDDFWPYISDSGTLPPESCVFGQLLNLSALFLAITVYLRHRQIVEFYWHRFKQTGCWRNTSCFILWLGYASAFGISIVANFQETNQLHTHYSGAFLAFGCGLLYAWAQTTMSYKMNPKLAEPRVSNFRFLLCTLATFFFFSALTFAFLGRPPHDSSRECCQCKCSLYQWTGEESNYHEHQIATVSEWCLAICFQIYILSFASELRHAYCHAPKLKLIASFHDEGPMVVETNTSTGIAGKIIKASIRRRFPASRIDTSPAGGSTARKLENGQLQPPPLYNSMESQRQLEETIMDVVWTTSASATLCGRERGATSRSANKVPSVARRSRSLCESSRL